MRLVATCVGWCLAFSVLIGQQHAATSTDEAAVRRVVDQYMAARERRDPKAIEQVFAVDADQRTTAGEWRRGRAAVVPGTLESSKRNAGTRSIKVEAVRFVAPDVAIADGPYEIAGGGSGDVRRMWTTIVLTRGAEGWRITAIRNMAP
ncbi:MAG TPA: SgcJ/EcaC family oxidoreductase [Vicinamibacterales bacterium]